MLLSFMLGLTTLGLVLWPKAGKAVESLGPGPNCTPERHTQMESILERGDYTAWVKLMNGRGVVNRVDESEFADFIKAHELVEEGKIAEANQIREKIGLRSYGERGAGQGMGRGQGMGKNR